MWCAGITSSPSKLHVHCLQQQVTAARVKKKLEGKRWHRKGWAKLVRLRGHTKDISYGDKAAAGTELVIY